MTAPIFVDSNVLLYALDDRDKQKQKLASEWRSNLWNNRTGRVSFQVLQEFYVNAIRSRPSSHELARAEVRDLLAWNPVTIDSALLELGWDLQDRYHLSYWDSLIVAAAKISSCAYLLTEDLHPGQRLDGVEVISPFHTDPGTAL